MLIRCNITFNKLLSVFHASCAVIDDEFRHNIVKAVDPRGDSRVDPQTIMSYLSEKCKKIWGSPSFQI